MGVIAQLPHDGAGKRTATLAVLLLQWALACGGVCSKHSASLVAWLADATQSCCYKHGPKSVGTAALIEAGNRPQTWCALRKFWLGGSG